MKKNFGFSLIELAIALTVLGFCVFLTMNFKATNLTGDVNKILITWQNYREMVTSFRSIYGYWPGDLTAAQMVGRLKNTSNNSYYAAGLPTSNYWNINSGNVNEVLNATRQLAFAFPEAGIQIDYTVPATPSATTPTTSIFTSQNFYTILQPVDLKNIPQAFVLLSQSSTTPSFFSFSLGRAISPFSFNSFTPSLSKLLDTKGDDGVANAGQIMPASGASCSSGAVYAVSNTGFNCQLFFFLDKSSSVYVGDV